MSEYQYFEFQAVDKPLSEKEIRQLRSYSTRARITPTSFVNHYNWGDFKGNPDDWMVKYFDAFLYFANWETRTLSLRLPSRLVNPKTAKEYCHAESAYVRVKSDKVILNFENEEGDIYECFDDEMTLASFLPIRADLAKGDLRALYLGWLLCVRNHELDDDELEPPVPPGLEQLNASLKNMVAFLKIDHDLLHVAAQASPPLRETELKREEVKAWVANMSEKEKNRFLTEMIIENDPSIVTELLRRFIRENSDTHDSSASTRRTVDELLQATEIYAEERKRIEAKKRAEEKARREREAAIAREKYLDGLAGQEPELWAEVDNLIATKQPKKYDQAVKILCDLRDLAQRSQSSDFSRQLGSLRQVHARKPSLIKRLNKADL